MADTSEIRARVREIEKELRTIRTKADLDPRADPNVLVNHPVYGADVKRLTREWKILCELYWQS